MPREGKCNHRRCDAHEGCRMLTDEELRPEAEDIEYGKKLVAEGWRQTSRKFRMIARLPPDRPRVADLLLPEARDSWLGREISTAWHGYPEWRAYDAAGKIEQRTLTVKQFAAFRLAGGGF